jgi:hypothetical protein
MPRRSGPIDVGDVVPVAAGHPATCATGTLRPLLVDGALAPVAFDAVTVQVRVLP